ncbi:MAG: hypothetical protein WCD18_08255, partial [Thermosynechococcaceae cyanobacterium]
LWNALEPELLGLSREMQLQVAGQALCDLAEVCQRRADLMWGEWQDLHNTNGPIPEDDFLAGLVQKTMFLDISDLVRQPKYRTRSRSTVEHEGESVAEVVTKEEALSMAVEEEAETEEAIQRLEYDEDVAAWVEAIRQWLMVQQANEVVFVEMLEGVNLSRVKIWLGLLLGGFELRQSGSFYDAEGVAIAQFKKVQAVREKNLSPV